MNMVGVHVVACAQRRGSLLQTVERQAIGRIDAWRAQDTDDHSPVTAKSPQLALGISSATSARGRRTKRARLVNQRPGTIAIDPAGAYIDDSLW